MHALGDVEGAEQKENPEVQKEEEQEAPDPGPIPGRM